MANLAYKQHESVYQPETKEYLITRFWDETQNQPKEHARLIERGKAIKCFEGEMPIGLYTQLPV
jgi:hypothetical protein